MAKPKYPSEEWFSDNGYLFPKRLPDGRYQAIYNFLFTVAIIIIEDQYRPAGRWCYENFIDALDAHNAFIWDGQSDPPGAWIKAKGFGTEDRINPLWANE